MTWTGKAAMERTDSEEEMVTCWRERTHRSPAEQGRYLPEAHPDVDGAVAFASPEDEEGFRQAEVEVERGPR